MWLCWEVCWEPRFLTRTLGEVLFLIRKPLVCTLLGTLSVHQLVENSDFSFALDNEALSRLFIRPGVWERAKQAAQTLQGSFSAVSIGCIDADLCK